MDRRQQQIDAAKAFVRASFHEGQYTGDESLTAHTAALSKALRALEPVGAIDQQQAAELLGSGAATVRFTLQDQQQAAELLDSAK